MRRKSTKTEYLNSSEIESILQSVKDKLELLKRENIRITKTVLPVISIGDNRTAVRLDYIDPDKRIAALEFIPITEELYIVRVTKKTSESPSEKSENSEK